MAMATDLIELLEDFSSKYPEVFEEGGNFVRGNKDLEEESLEFFLNMLDIMIS